MDYLSLLKNVPYSVLLVLLLFVGFGLLIGIAALAMSSVYIREAVKTVWSVLVVITRILPRRKRETGFKYIYVYEDGSAREVTLDEQERLLAHYHVGDGSRPYFKDYYEQRSISNEMWGYLPRRLLPAKITIQPVPEKEEEMYKRNEASGG